jgi:hypothetical protein
MSCRRFIASRSEALLASVLLIAACGGLPAGPTANAAAPTKGGWQAASNQPRAADRDPAVQWSPAPKSRANEDSTRTAAPTNASATIAIKRTQPVATTANGDARRNKQATADPRWRLPNATATNPSTVGTQPSAGRIREPREFQAPANAQPLNSAQAGRRNGPPSYQSPGPAATVAQASTASGEFRTKSSAAHGTRACVPPSAE